MNCAGTTSGRYAQMVLSKDVYVENSGPSTLCQGNEAYDRRLMII